MHSLAALSHAHAGPTSRLGRGLILGISATLVIALASHIAFPLPFTPVPFTLQPLAVLGVGLWLGPVSGFFATLAYLVEGALGLPVFSPTGFGGVAQLLGPTGGYLLAYPLVAATAGGLTSTLKCRIPVFVAATLACLTATLFLFTAGASWLAWETHLSVHQAWVAGVAPFLPGDVIKALAAAGMYRAFHRPAAR